MDKFLAFLQDKKAVAIACILSLVTQLWHSIQAFVHLEIKGTNEFLAYIFGIFFAVSTSFAILIFTIRGSKKLAYFFLLVEVFVNIIHYGVMGLSDPMVLFPTIFMCLIVPVTISVYSSAINDDTVNNQQDNLKETDDESFISPNLSLEDRKIAEQEFSEYRKKSEDLKNVQNIEKTEQTEEIGMKDEHFIDEVNKLIGFDITNSKDKSGNVSEDKRKELRKLWKKKSSLSQKEIKDQINEILNEKIGNPLFKNL